MRLAILRTSILILAATAVFAITIPELSEFALLTAGVAIVALVAWKRKVT